MTLAETMQPWDFTQATMLIIGITQGMLWLLLLISKLPLGRMRGMLSCGSSVLVTLMVLGGLALYALLGAPCIHFMYWSMFLTLVGMVSIGWLLWWDRRTHKMEGWPLYAVILLYGLVTLSVQLSLGPHMQRCYVQFTAERPPSSLMARLETSAMDEQKGVFKSMAMREHFQMPWHYLCVEKSGLRQSAAYLQQHTGVVLDQKPLAVGIRAFKYWLLLADRSAEHVRYIALEQDRWQWPDFFCGPLEQSQWQMHVDAHGGLGITAHLRSKQGEP
ncbi:hypothetical protein Mmc1_1934 [Magnetococcus marinus MC-1]|uniref:Uncharacterized protein n=1 Tax=Magnetococcus marinus (strain ATCC BAA-1437 / JCM 17883 / MC-1) TaxID=156889 RepID=A0L8Z9_MAGMM|nr:hypothetical protein [Magnetococcus marinus]ABK44442.1 hypothetical protein Mmc1_1934 [Magnetococcus marinus MC-1]